MVVIGLKTRFSVDEMVNLGMDTRWTEDTLTLCDECAGGFTIPVGGEYGVWVVDYRTEDAQHLDPTDTTQCDHCDKFIDRPVTIGD